MAVREKLSTASSLLLQLLFRALTPAMRWDERSAQACWGCWPVASRDTRAAATVPPLPRGPVLSLRYDGAPAWAAQVCAAWGRLGCSVVVPQRVEKLYSGPRATARLLAFAFACSDGTHLVADVGHAPFCVLQSKSTLALACLAAGSPLAPASFHLPWTTNALPRTLGVCASQPWVLKRDAQSNGEGVFFVTSAAAAMEVMASQRAGSYLTLLSSDSDVSHFVMQRHVDRPALLEKRKFHLRAYVVAHAGALLLWHHVEVRLAARPYTGDISDRLQALTNFAPARGEAGHHAGLLIKRIASEFANPGQLGCAQALQGRVSAFLGATAALVDAVGDGESDGEAVSAEDGTVWRGVAVLAVDLMLDESDRLWLLEVNRGPAAGEESLEDGLQSKPYKRHLEELSTALLLLACPPAMCGKPDEGPQFRAAAGFTPLPVVPCSSRWNAPTRRELRTLLRWAPPYLQAGFALASRRERGDADDGDDRVVLAHTAAVAGEELATPGGFARALAGYRDSAGRSAMHAAAEAGLSLAVALLFNIAPELLTAPDAGGATPLGLAARGGHAAAGIALLHMGADPNSPDLPCHAAAAADCAPLIRALALAGANLDKCETSGTPLHWAAGEGCSAATAMLLAAGANPNATDADHMPPLLLAVVAGHGAVVSLLLDAGADPRKAALPGGASVLHVAADVGDAESVRALLGCKEGRAMAVSRDGDGMVPREVAAASGAGEALLALFDHSSVHL